LIARAAPLTLLALVLTGCAGAEVAADEIQVRYGGGGMGEEKTFKECLEPGTNIVAGNLAMYGDTSILIPVGQRTYKAKAGDETAEQGPMTFTVRGVDMTTEAQVELVVNTNCERPDEDTPSPVEDLATRFGLKYERLHGAGWWVELERDYIGRQVDQALDDAAARLVRADPKMNWRRLLEDESAKDALQAETGRRAVELVRTAMGGDRFCGPTYKIGDKVCPPFVVTLTPPRPPGALVDGIIAEENAVQATRTAMREKTRNAAQASAEAKLLAVYGPAGMIERRRLDLMDKAIDSGKITVWPVPAGASVVAPGPGR